MTWNAADYHRSSAAQQQWARELIEKLDLRGQERVLDLGCGDGKITAEIAAQVPQGQVIGIDSSPEMIAFAREHFSPETHPHLTFLVQDARALAFTASFDVVFSNAALHWLLDHRPVLAGIARALVPGGRLLAQMGGRGNAATMQAVVQDIITHNPWMPYFSDFTSPYGFYGPEEYQRWLEEAGLRPLHVTLFSKDMVQPGADGLAGWFRTTWFPYLSRVPAAQRESFVDTVISAYLTAYPPDANGGVHVGMVRLEVAAEKPV